MEKPLDSDSWFSGFTDGEGHFAIRRVAPGTWYPRFAIKLRADDFAILRLAQKTFGGTLGYSEPSCSDLERHPGSKARVFWCVDRLDDLIRLVSYFDTYPLRAKKSRDYRIWRHAVLLRQNGTSAHSRVLLYLRKSLIEARSYDDVESIEIEPPLLLPLFPEI